MRRCWALLLLLMLPATGARAQEIDSTTHFQQQMGTQRISTVALSTVEPRYRWAVGLMYSYSKSPLMGANAGLVSARNLVSDQHAAEIQLVLGLPWVQLGIALPLSIYQTGEPWTDLSGQEHEEVEHWAVGDLRLHAKVRLLDPRRHRLGIALGVDLGTPTGQADRFNGSPSAVFTPRLVLDYWVGKIATIALNVGYVLRKAERLERLVIDDQLLLSAGLVIRLGTFGAPVYLYGEIVAATQISDPFGTEGGTPVEGRFGIRLWNSEHFFVEIGWGTAIVRGDGLPRFRVALDIGLTFLMPGMRRAKPKLPDRDGDGIPDSRDRCPTEPEDLDGFEDNDGCPEPGTPEPPEKVRQAHQPPPRPRWWQRWRARVAKMNAARKRLEAERQARQKRDTRNRRRVAADRREEERRSKHFSDRRKRLSKTLDKLSGTVGTGRKKVSGTLREIKRKLRARPRRRPPVRPGPRPRARTTNE